MPAAKLTFANGKVRHEDVETGDLLHVEGYDKNVQRHYDVKCVVILTGTTIAGSSNANDTHAGYQPHSTAAALAAGDLILVITDPDSSPTAVTGIHKVNSSGNASPLSDGFHASGSNLYSYSVRVHNNSTSYLEQDRMYMVSEAGGEPTFELGTDAVVATEIGDHKLKEMEKVIDSNAATISTNNPESGLNSEGDLFRQTKTDHYVYTSLVCRENAGTGDIADDEKSMSWDVDSATLRVHNHTHTADQSRDITLAAGVTTSYRLTVGDTTSGTITDSNRDDPDHVPVQFGGNLHADGNAWINEDLRVVGEITHGGSTSTSDMRLKTKTRDLHSPDMATSLLSLQGIQYHLNNDPKRRQRFGFSAQEVQSVFPQLVRKDELGFLSLDYIGLIAPLVETVKEQQAQINELQSRLSKLESS